MAIIKKIGYKIDPLDLNTRKALGVKVPFNKKGIFDFNYTTKDQIKSNLINLLLTSPGERFHEPTYGVGIRDYIFEQNTDDFNSKIANLKQLISRKLGTHIPQIKLANLAVSPVPNSNNLIINIKYTILLDNDTNQISLQL
jgi:phage baseplate assembly protein W|tara:strand:- start:2519 stop:2941 length:423 start_codon:yes stop_codon:yes gene_type:complete